MSTKIQEAKEIQKKKLEALRAKLGSQSVRGKGVPRRKKLIQKPKLNSRQLLDNLLDQVYTNEISNVSGIYLLNKDGQADLHFNFPKVNLVAKAFAYVIHGTVTKTMKEDSSSEEEANSEDEKTGVTVEDEIPAGKVKSNKGKSEITEEVGKRKSNKWERRFRGMVKKNGIQVQKMPYSSVRFVLKDQNFIAKNAEIEKVSKDAYLVYGRLEIESDDKIAQLAEEFGENLDFSKVGLGEGENQDDDDDDDDDIPDLVSFNEKTVDSTAKKTEDSTTIPEDVKFSETDVAMVMDQTTATREQAIKALTEHDGDMIEAIMNLS